MEGQGVVVYSASDYVSVVSPLIEPFVSLQAMYGSP